MANNLPREIFEALDGLVGEAPLRDGAVLLLNTLGYASNRTADVGNVREFLERFQPESPLTDKQLDLFDDWRQVDIVFQITSGEIEFSLDRPSLSSESEFDQGRAKSFLFLAVDLRPDKYSRAQLANTTRIVNRLFTMPVIILYRYGSALTMAAVHRQASKRDDNLDVLTSVTLVKDICLKNPHRAHIEILADLALKDLVQTGAVHNFDDLHVKWEQALDIEELNKRFYKELFAWFERATRECRFPADGAGDGCAERHVIRLITRLLFIWFLKEKGLVPEELFREEFAREHLSRYSPNNTDYYRAVLQNLFFATLNTEVEKRAFSVEENTAHRDFNKYLYHNMLRDPERFVKTLKQIPFVNGGLFDCLDNFLGASGRQIDAFTDRMSHDRDLHVPAWLLLDDDNGIFSLFRHYKFTTEENTPLNTEVALDPELLGRAFENLLAAYNPETSDTARKLTGSFYTPRQVVDYMVREALTEALAAKAPPDDGDPKYWRGRIDYLLDHSAAMDDAQEFFSTDERGALVTAVADLKTLDPAVGSGAFPMSILQVLTVALRRLDPDNTLWMTLQRNRAAARAKQAFDVVDQRRREDELVEICTMFDKYRESDFGRKLYLIQNGIYGVDIQPIACQIAKLRFFISLAIEQQPDPTAQNLGFKPLPNLETHFVAADTLISLGNEAAPLLLDERVVTKCKEVAAVRERYFLADSRQKLACIESEQRLRGELRSVLEAKHDLWNANQQRAQEEIDDTSKDIDSLEARKEYRRKEAKKLAANQRAFEVDLGDAQKIANWDPYDQNASANWFAPEYMFGISGGFDIVIGNPPYIQLQKDGGYLRKRYSDAGYKTFASTGDIYQLFLERGCRLLKNGEGILAYITSNSWLKAQYGKSLRRWLEEHHTPLRLIEMGKDVFENAIVDTVVLIVRNSKVQTETCLAVDVEQSTHGQFPPPAADWGTLQPKGEQPWMALSPIERTVMDKIEVAGIPLKEWDISIYRGILTGYNDAFIVDQVTRDDLIKADVRSAEILKPILRGRDIARYRANWAGLWLIDTHNGYNDERPIDVDDYPAVKAHLNKFIKRLDHRHDKGVTPYNLRNCAYHGEFEQTKLIWMHMTPYGRFALARPNVICNQKCFMIAGTDLEYLCAILNSKLMTWLICQTAVTTGMGLPQWDKFTVERVPVVKPSRYAMDKLRTVVEHILANVERNNLQEVNNLQRMVDRQVFELYSLTDVECEVVSRTIGKSWPFQ